MYYSLLARTLVFWINITALIKVMSSSRQLLTAAVGYLHNTKSESKDLSRGQLCVLVKRFIFQRLKTVIPASVCLWALCFVALHKDLLCFELIYHLEGMMTGTVKAQMSFFQLFRHNMNAANTVCPTRTGNLVSKMYHVFVCRCFTPERCSTGPTSSICYVNRSVSHHV